MRYLALFRGINVGGKNVIKMNELKQLLLDLQLHNVQTYIQSGNAVFESEKDEPYLLKIIDDGFAGRFGFESGVIIRNLDEMRTIVEQLPFSPDEIAAAERIQPEVEHLYVYFLSSPAEQSRLDGVCRKYTGPDMLRIGKRELYLLCQESIRQSKLGIDVSKTWSTATVRNWKSVCHLYGLMAHE